MATSARTRSSSWYGRSALPLVDNVDDVGRRCSPVLTMCAAEPNILRDQLAAGLANSLLL